MTGVETFISLLLYLGVLVFGGLAVVAFGLLIARRTRAARMVFALELFCAAVIGAWAILSCLDRGNGGHDLYSYRGIVIILTVLSLILAGAGQLVAASRSPWTYAWALGVTAGCVVLSWAALGIDPPLERPQLILAGMSLILAVSSLTTAVLSDKKKDQTSVPHK